MLFKRAFLRAAGEGALAGCAGGLVLGAWDVRVSRDLDHNMLWLAAERVLQPMMLLGLAGLALSLTLAAMAATLRGRLPARRMTGARTLGGLMAMAGMTIMLLRQQVFPLTSVQGSPRLALAACGAVILCGLALSALRLLDILKDPDETIPRFQRRGLHLARLGASLLAAVVALSLAWPMIGTYRAGQRPSVIVVSLDTLRADRLGVLGASPSPTPNLDSLAEEGMLFTEAQSAAPWTLPSHTSLFTSLLPFAHHVQWSWMHISPARALLAEHFRNAGYRTGAITGGGYVASHFGFDQGFQVYEDHDEIAENGPEQIAAATERWLETTGDSPFFLFLHTYEAHSPFQRDSLGGKGSPGRLAAGVTFEEVEAIHAGELVLTEEEKQHVIGLYDADVAHVDTVIGGLLRNLRDSGRLEDTILVVLSDHGEDLWDHSDSRSPGHGHSLYQELIRVPLFVRAPGRVPGGKRITTPVSLLDVAPTLLALAGLHPDPRHQGRSLETTLMTSTEPAAVSVFAESVEYGPDRFMERLGSLKVVLTPTPEIAHHDVQMPVDPLEIYQLRDDPYELQNLAREGDLTPADAPAGEAIAAARPLVRALRARTMEILFGQKEGDEASDVLPPELEEQLRSLGYIQ